MLNPKTLAEKAAELRAVAERMEDLAKRQEELERERTRLAKEEEDLAQWVAGGGSSLSQQDGTASPSVAPSIKAVPAKQVALELFPHEPRTQREWVLHLIGTHGELTRDELMEKLIPTGKAPASTEYLSAVLSALKKMGRLRFGNDYRWSLTNPPATSS